MLLYQAQGWNKEKQLRSTIRNQTLDLGISLYNAARGARMAQWWKHLHPTTVRSRFDSWIWHHIWGEFVVGSPPFLKLISRGQGRSWAFFATSLSLLTVQPLEVTSLYFLLTISPLNQILRSQESRKWSLTKCYKITMYL